MQIISMMTTKSQTEQSSIPEAVRPADLNVQKPVENTASAKTVSDKKDPENTSSEQKDFAKMMNDQAEKKEAQVAQKEEKSTLVRIAKKGIPEGNFLLKDNSAGKFLISEKKNVDQKTAILDDGAKKGKKKTKNVQLEQLHLAKAVKKKEDEILPEDETQTESSLVGMVLNVTKKEDGDSDTDKEIKSVVKTVSELDKKVNMKAENEENHIHKVSLEHKTGNEDLVKEISLQTNASEGIEKAEIKNVDLKDNTGLADQNKSEPIILVTDRRSQADLAEGKPIEPTTLIRQALKESGNSEIVQRAQFILRDQSAGEIRLTLKPENLGTVRINLTLDDHRVLGRIVVDNAEVKAAFDDNMSDLRERMQRGGFTMDQLDVSVGQHKKGEDFQQQNAHSESPFYSERHREGNKVFNQIQETPMVDSYRSVLVNVRA